MSQSKQQHKIAVRLLEKLGLDNVRLELQAGGHYHYHAWTCTSPEKTDTKINLSVTSYEFGPCEESVHLEADTTLGFNLLFFSFFFEKVLLCASQVASYPFGV